MSQNVTGWMQLAQVRARIVFYRQSLAAGCCEQDNEILAFINLRNLLDWHSEHKLDKTDCISVCLLIR